MITKEELKEIAEDFVAIRRALHDREGDTDDMDTAAVAGQVLAARIIAGAQK